MTDNKNSNEMHAEVVPVEEAPRVRVTPEARWKDENDALRIAFALPGVAREDVELSLENRVLTLTATRARKDDVLEYRRSLELPEGVGDANVEAKLENGVLFLRVMRKQPARVEISV